MLPPSPSVTVALCDPSEISRVGIVRALERHGVLVAAETCDGATGADVVRAAGVDVVLVDMGVQPAPETAVGLLRLAAGMGVPAVAIGVEADPEAVFAAIRAGAVGYLTKDMPVAAWGRAVVAATRGETWIPRAITALLVDYVRNHSAAAPLAELMPSERRLTRRELAVLESVARGNSNRAVATELSISVETVRTHVSHILAKLGTPTRTGAVSRYHQLRAASVG
jgi:DNA-binding NarL/FixJ family response regulator